MGQDATPHSEPDPQDPGTPPMGQEDVLLDIPVLKVDSIDLEVTDLRARVSLQAEVLNLLRLNVGVDAVLGQVRLDVRGVEAQALLKVRLDRVAEILNRVLSTIDSHPEIIDSLTRVTAVSLDQAGRGLGQTLPAAATAAGTAATGSAATGSAATGTAATGTAATGTAGAGEAAGQAGPGKLIRETGSAVGRAVREAGQSLGRAERDLRTAAQDLSRGAVPPAQQANPPVPAGPGAGPDAPRGGRETRRWSSQAGPPWQPDQEQRRDQPGQPGRPGQQGGAGQPGQGAGRGDAGRGDEPPSIEAGATVEADSSPGTPAAGHRERATGLRRYRGLLRRNRRS